MSVERPLSRPIVIVKNADSPITFPLARPLVRSNVLNAIPAGAIQLRDGSYLLDRAGNNIQVRV